MANPTVSTGRIDAQMGQISLANGTDLSEYINGKVLPSVPVAERSGKIVAYGNEHMRTYSSFRSDDDRSNHEIDFKVTNTDSYEVGFHDLEFYISDQKAQAFQKPIDMKRDATLVLDRMKNQSMEGALATALADATVLTNTTTPATLWDVATSNPVSDIETACEAVRGKKGRRPNYAVTNAVVISKLQSHPAYVDRSKYSQKLGVISKRDLIDMIKLDHGLDDVYVGQAVGVTTQEGQAETVADLWQDDFLVYTAPKRGSLFTPSFGYRFEMAEFNYFDTRRSPNDKGNIYRTNWAFQDNILDVDASYLLNQVIT